MGGGGGGGKGGGGRWWVSLSSNSIAKLPIRLQSSVITTSAPRLSIFLSQNVMICSAVRGAVLARDGDDDS